MAKEFDPESRNPVLNDGDVVQMFEELGALLTNLCMRFGQHINNLKEGIQE